MMENRPAMVPAQPGWRAVYFWSGGPSLIFNPIVAWAGWPPGPPDDEREEFDAVVVDGECMGLAQEFSSDTSFLGYIPPEKSNKDWESKNKERIQVMFENAEFDNKKKSS